MRGSEKGRDLPGATLPAGQVGSPAMAEQAHCVFPWSVEGQSGSPPKQRHSPFADLVWTQETGPPPRPLTWGPINMESSVPHPDRIPFSLIY